MLRFVLLIHDHPFVHWDFLDRARRGVAVVAVAESPDRWRSVTDSTALSREAIAIIG